jgi:hypothetical protein
MGKPSRSGHPQYHPAGSESRNRRDQNHPIGVRPVLLRRGESVRVIMQACNHAAMITYRRALSLDQQTTLHRKQNSINSGRMCLKVVDTRRSRALAFSRKFIFVRSLIFLVARKRAGPTRLLDRPCNLSLNTGTSRYHPQAREH